MTHQPKSVDAALAIDVASLPSELADRAMLVSLNQKQWTGHRFDRKVTQEVNEEHNASADAGRYNKRLLPPEATREIQSIISATRNEFLARTAPWSDEGERIMVADQFVAFSQWFDKRKTEFEAAVEKFLTKYPEYVSEAKERLGDLYNATDYPAADQLRGKYAFTVKALPVPSKDDFRVRLSVHQVDHIKGLIEDNLREATENALSGVRARIAGVVERIVERMDASAKAEKEGKKVRLFATMIDDVAELIDVLPALNITADPAIDELATKLRALIVPIEDLRASPEKRHDMAANAEAIMNDLDELFA